MKKRTRAWRRAHLVWPPYTYVARFAGGEEVRLSIAGEKGKGLPFDTARKMVAQTIGNERGRAAILSKPHIFPMEGRPLTALKRAGWNHGDLPVKIGIATRPAWKVSAQDLVCAVFPPAADLVMGYLELDGVAHPDPGIAALRPSSAPALRVVRARTISAGNAASPSLAALRRQCTQWRNRAQHYRPGSAYAALAAARIAELELRLAATHA